MGPPSRFVVVLNGSVGQFGPVVLRAGLGVISAIFVGTCSPFSEQWGGGRRDERSRRVEGGKSKKGRGKVRKNAQVLKATRYFSP